MENLLALLNKIQQVSPLSIFEQEHIIVQNAGMRHWLSMSIAQSRGIAMNLAFALPAQYLWKLLRTIARDEDIPAQSPYAREVLVWRIFDLLTTNDILDDDSFSAPTDYWQSAQSGNEQQQKRYQLSLKLADLYEQYLIFRPEWVDDWCQGIYTLPLEFTDNEAIAGSYQWQGKLWQILQQQQSYNPKELLEAAISNLENKKNTLPKRIVFFGINALAPLWLNFLEQLGQFVDIHFFHLNPCVDYWGDIQSEKQIAKHYHKQLTKQLMTWTEGAGEFFAVVGNPLLANWGQQGREFLSLLQQVSTINIDAFEQLSLENKHSSSLLSQLQQDILTLNDARDNPRHLVDNSLTVTSCHSAFREVQALHDWLLHQLDSDDSLTPKDVLVMCPEIEHYAPYVQAVFTRSWQDIDEKVPPLPCSIADRSPKNADPLITTFVDLLALPDSRFHVSSIIGILKLEAVQKQFALSSDDITTISYWLAQASVHWGLNATHKNTLLTAEQEVNNQSNAFTWQQGLSKLLQGFAYGDDIGVVNDVLMLPYVEGNNGRILGQLMLFLHTLKDNAIQLTTPKTMTQWHHYLLTLLAQVYHPSAEESVNTIASAIGMLSQYHEQATNVSAAKEEKISLLVIKEFLSAHFSTPDPSRQFMVGQVTFCSMLPMRSVPFRIIAVLGLNDGEYPRQRQPLAFDLMAMSAPKLGDRSRRGDDRYLFLEALISARDTLYLSYQGRNINNNKKREPSIVLQELFDYLSIGYKWNCQLENDSDIRQMPLQAFNEKNYHGEFPSFDANWLTLANQSVDARVNINDEQMNISANTTDNATENIEVTEIEVDDLVRFYQHPSKWYAQRALSIYFEQYDLLPSDTEQFTYDRLASYQLKQQLLFEKLARDDNDQTATDSLLAQATLSGRFADSPLTEQYFDKWQQDNEIFTDAIKTGGLTQIESMPASISLLTSQGKLITIKANLPIAKNEKNIAFYRSSTAKPKDLFNLYLTALIAQVHSVEQSVESKEVTGLFFDTKSQKVSQYNVATINNAQQHLAQLIDTFIVGQSQPLLLNTQLAHQYFQSKNFKQTQLENFWCDTHLNTALGIDPYIHFFWKNCPQVEDIIKTVSPIYQEMYRVLEKTK